MIKVSNENVNTSYWKNKINGHDIKDEHMFTLVILKRHVCYNLHRIMIFKDDKKNTKIRLECDGAAVLLYTNKCIYQFVSICYHLEI
jgi:hypothetical protein